MSFKREGDDTSQLNILKKRRVSDLLSHFIPEDEAALMRNGRYTCLVCSYRPVFDTVDMLTVHRKGKKHLEGLKAFYGKKMQLKAEITKRRHEKYVEAEEQSQETPGSAPLLAQTRKLTHHALLKSAPYNSRHRRMSTKREKAPAGRSCDVDTDHQTTSARGRSDVRSGGPAGKTPPGLVVHREVDETPPDATRVSNTEDVTGSGTATAAEDRPMTPQRKRELEHFLKLKSDGWLRDRSGRWVKDDNVEFDSDEDEPPPLPSS